MAANLSTLRSQVELALAGRVAAPFTLRDRNIENVSTGISEVDALVGGLPRGALTEIFGPACSGRTSLLFSALGARTTRAEACALIDGCDAFDPRSAEAAGIDLKQLLWVRCRNMEQSFRATDLLLQAGGFGFIALDLSDVPSESVHRVPLDTWFRFRRAVESTPRHALPWSCGWKRSALDGERRRPHTLQISTGIHFRGFWMVRKFAPN